MRSRYLTAVALAALIGAPSVAAAATPMPSHMNSMSSSSKTNSSSNMKTQSTKKNSKKKAGQVQSTMPGAPGYSGSSPLGSAEKKKP